MVTLATPQQITALQALLKKKAVVLYHRDGDGIPSVVLLKKFFPVIEAIPREGPKLEKRFIKELIAKKPEVLLSVDLPLDEEWKKLLEIQKALPGTGIGIIDHHIIQDDLNKRGMVHINPKFHQDTYLPASYVVYRLLEKIVGDQVKSLVWLAGIGVISDHAYEECTDLLDEIDPTLVHKDPKQSTLFEGAELIGAAVTVKGLEGARYMVDQLLKAKTYEDMKNNTQLQQWKQEADEEFQKIIDGFDKGAEAYEKLKLIVYEIKSPLSLTSASSSYFSEQFPDQVVMIRKKAKDGYKISVRCQDGHVNVGEMMNECSKGIGLGGGHAKAAGGYIYDWDEFLNRVLTFLE